MDYIVQGVNYHISDKTRDLIDKYFKKTKYFDSILTSLKITIHKEPHHTNEQIHITAKGHIKHNRDIFLEIDGDTLAPTLHTLSKKLFMKLEKEKEHLTHN